MYNTLRSKGQQEFLVEKRDGILYVGKEAEFSQIAAQMIVHEAMSSTRYKYAGFCSYITKNDGTLVFAVGYKPPMFFKRKALDEVIDALKNYEYVFSDAAYSTAL